MMDSSHGSGEGEHLVGHYGVFRCSAFLKTTLEMFKVKIIFTASYLLFEVLLSTFDVLTNDFYYCNFAKR